MKSGRIWPFIIMGLLGLNMAIVGVTVYAANSDRSFAVVPDYYRKGLRWDDSARQQERNGSLGWTLDATLEPRASAAAPGRLSVRFTDGAGRPIRAAKMMLEAFHDADPANVTRVELANLGEGAFVATLPPPRHGLWTLRFVADAAGMRFTSAQTLDAPASPGEGARACSR